ncbi:MAG: DUF3127 domain-containing protein [Pseudarcicella sp.]|nr:DUF3127 domain-containing protein [Pseudarcicella sp.]MBP6410048.1 DUF3127 domain-containing protein [Pseudarcicella sp.]
MALEFEGSLIKILPEVTGQGQKGPWVKQDFVIETEEQYPKKGSFSAWGERVEELKGFSLGEKIKVTFSVESREYNERWYTDLRAYRIEKMGASTSAPTSNAGFAPKTAEATPAASLPTFSEADDDLPF